MIIELYRREKTPGTVLRTTACWAYLVAFLAIFLSCVGCVGGSRTSITTSQLPGAEPGILYTAALDATGGNAPYHWAVETGALPSGITLNAKTGALAGVTQQIGNFKFAVRVSDSSPYQVQTAAKSIGITVGVALLQITTGALPAVQTGNRIQAQLAATGGAKPYRWSVVSGALPPGLSLSVGSGVLSGTPSQNGQFDFSIQVMDSSSPSPQTAAEAFSLSIGASGAPSITAQPNNQTVVAGQAAAFSVSASGTPPLSYQWKNNGVLISGATSSPTYTTAPETISDTGTKITAVVSNPAGSVTSNPATLTVTAAPTEITVNPSHATLTTGNSQQFEASVTGTSNTAVVWSLSGAGCSGTACGTISPSGLYTSPAGVPSTSTVTVTAIMAADPSKSVLASVTLVAALAVVLSVSPTNASVPAAGTQTFAATVTGTSNTAVMWSVSGAGCSGATCGTLSTSGALAVYQAPSVAPSQAEVNVTATSLADPTKSASASVAIAPSVFVTVTPTNVSVTAGTAQQFNASVTGTANVAVTWLVSGSGCTGAACGAISSSGLYTAPSSVPSPATLTVVATSIADPTKSASAAVSIAFGTSSTATDGISIPSAHPRLFWNAARLAQAQHWWATNSYTPNYTNPNAFDPYDTLFACLMSQNSQWCNAQIAWATTLSQTNCYQTVGCDSMRVYGEAVILTYDWLYSQMTSAQRATLLSNWNTWQSYIDTQNSWGNTGMPASNYFAGALRTDFSLGVATEGDNANSTSFLNYGLNSRWAALVNYDSLTGTGPLGARGYALHNQEGLQYGRYSLSYYAVPLASSALLGRDLWQETTAFKAGVLQTIYNTLPMQTTSRGLYDGWTWSDDENWIQGAGLYGGGGMQSRYFGDFMMAAAQEFPTSTIGMLARQWISAVKPTIGPMWLAVDAGGSTQSFATLPLDYYASGPQYAYWRNSWNTNASSLFLQMGETSGVGHAHYDIGGFQWFRNGSYLIRETPGYLTSVAGYNSVGGIGTDSGFAHNVPLVGGVSEVTAGCTDGNAVVNRLESQPAYSYIDADISGVYTNNACAGNHPERENTFAQHVEREFIFFRDIETLLVLDRLQADTASRSRTFASHCETSPNSIDAQHYSCIDGSQQASYSVLLPAQPALVVVNEAANGATCGAGACQYRLEINDNSPSGAQSYFLVAIQGLSANGTRLVPTLKDNGTSWTVTLDPNHSATLNKGTSSAGGSVTINGTTTNLRADVEPMTIGDNGPVW